MANRAYIATRKGLFILDRAQQGDWKVTGTAFLGDNLSIVTPDPRDGAIYVAIGHGHFGVKLHRSTDGGKSWTAIGSPTYPAVPEGTPPEVDSFGRTIPWSTQVVWSITPGGLGEDGTLWAGTAPGGLFKSADHGATWSLIRTLWDRPERKQWFGGGLDWPAIHSIIVDPRDSRHITIGISCGGVWVTRDGGETWACKADGMRAEYMPPDQAQDPNTQDPHLVAACANHPDAMWSQHHNGIFRTTNDCASWHEVRCERPSSFGFAVAVHPHDPDTAWFVPAIKDEHRIPVDGKFVVTRTRNGGESFEILSKGLPQEHAYDLVFRHALDVDASGQRLVMGSTTGSLWISEDAGDSWQTISTHLPPVHAVKFA